MSLNFNFEKVATPPEGGWWITDQYGGEELNPLTHAIVFATLAVDIGQITAENVDEFYARIHMLEAIDGPFYMESVSDGAGGTRWVKGISRDHLLAHIGLTTNVATRTRNQWSKSLFRSFPKPDPTAR